MNTEQTPLKGLMVINPRVFNDHRGYFFESFNHTQFSQHVAEVEFVQDNQSLSQQGVLRGLHFQLHPYAQGKLVRVIQGEIFDVAADLRQSSPTFGEYVAEVLSSKNKKQIYIPEGFAHGFLTLSKTSEVLYKVTDFYSPGHERFILWNDPILDIQWPKNINIQLSAKDLLGKSFKSSELFP